MLSAMSAGRITVHGMIPEIFLPGPARPRTAPARIFPAWHIEIAIAPIHPFADRRERTVLRPKFLAGRLRLRRMPRQIQTLVMLGSFERRQAGGDGVVGPGFDLHVVGRVGVDQVDSGAV